MKKLKLLLDVDEVICFSGYLELVNEFLNTNYEIDDFTDYYIDRKAIPKERYSEFIEFKRNKKLYEKPCILPDAIEVIKRLSEKVDVYICSACVFTEDIECSAQAFADKYNFLIKYLPFLDPHKFIFTSYKNSFKGDIQIDDRITNLENDIPLRILFPSYHNKDITEEELTKKEIIRAGYDWRTGWKKVEEIINEHLKKQ